MVGDMEREFEEDCGCMEPLADVGRDSERASLPVNPSKSKVDGPASPVGERIIECISVHSIPHYL